MSDTIGVKIQLDGAPEFTSNMKQMAAQTKEFKAQLDLATSGMDKHTSAYSKSKTMTEGYKNQLSALKNEQAAVAAQIDKVSNSENSNETYVTNLKAKYAELGTQINETQSHLNDLGGTLGAVGSQMQEVGGKISSVGEGASKVGGTLTATVTAPLVAGAASAVTSFGDVDKQFRLVKATMGDTANSAEDFGNLWRTMSKDAAGSVYSMQDSADALLNFARQGFTAKQSADMLKPALSLAAGTGTDLSAVTSGLGNAMKAFGASSGEAANYADILAQAQAQANTDTSNLFDAMSVAAPICKTVGWDVKDLATIVDIFGDNSISGSEGANALKTGLARLAAPASSGAKSMTKLGLSTGQTYAIFDNNGSMKDMQTVLGNLNKAFSGLSDQEKLEAASNIFGKNQMAKWLILMDTAPETVEQYRSARDSCTDTADDMADSLMSGVGGSIEKLKSTFDVFKTKVGEDIQDPVKDAIDNVTGLMDKFLSLDEATQKQILSIAGIAAAIGPVLLIGGKLITGTGNVITAIGTITKGIGQLTTKCGGVGAAIESGLTSPMGLAAAGIGAFIITYKGLDAAFSAVLPGYQEQKDAINELKTAMNNVQTANEQMASTMKSQADSISTTGSTLDLYKDKLNECFDAQGNLKSGCEGTASAIIDSLNEAMGTEYSISTKGFIQNTDGSKVSLQQLNDEIDKTVDALKRKAIQEALESDYADALQTQKDAQDALNDAISMYNDAVEKGLPQQHNYGLNVEKLAAQAGTAKGNLEGISDAMTKVADSSAYTAEQCEEAFTSISSGAGTVSDAYKTAATDAVHTGDQIQLTNEGVTTSTQEMAENTSASQSTVQSSLESTRTAIDNVGASASAAFPQFADQAEQANTRVGAATTGISASASTMQANTGKSLNDLKLKLNEVPPAADQTASRFGSAASRMSDDMSKSRENISKDIDKAKDSMDKGVSSMESKVRGAKWEWPHLKLPHFSVSGEFSLNPPSAPHISVEWYAKAMQAGMILNSPTIFGAQGGRLLGAGDAGPEVVVGASSLSTLVTNAVLAATGGEGARSIIMNVYGAEGQSVETLADLVADKINGEIQRKEAAFA